MPGKVPSLACAATIALRLGNIRPGGAFSGTSVNEVGRAESTSKRETPLSILLKPPKAAAFIGPARQRWQSRRQQASREGAKASNPCDA